MPYCSRCGNQVDQNAGFCAKCGTPVKQNTPTMASIPNSMPAQNWNTSGQGSNAVVPQDIQGWNWGAFLFSWIWGIGNNVWLALLALIPYVGFVVAIVLGVKGNEWAWKSKRWDSIEHFKKTQGTWVKTGLIIWGSLVILGILAAVAIPNIMRFSE